MTVQDCMVLGTILVDFDKVIDDLDRSVFETAYGLPGSGSLDGQRDCAMSPDFQPPIKIQRDQKMIQRNAVAALLGLQLRKPHDFSARDYVVQKDGTLEPR